MALRKLYSRRCCLAVVGTAWLLFSVAQGGLAGSCRALLPPDPPTQPNACQQWSGPYFDALNALAPSLGRGDTLAVVLSPADRPDQPAPPVRMYETIYRLYPARPDFYFDEGDPDCRPWWFPCHASEPPEVPELWAHQHVLWAGARRACPPVGSRPTWSNSTATLYRVG